MQEFFKGLYQKSKSINRNAHQGFAQSSQSIMQQSFGFACFANLLRVLRLKRSFDTASFPF
jgi:hypothetical protein